MRGSSKGKGATAKGRVEGSIAVGPGRLGGPVGVEACGAPCFVWAPTLGFTGLKPKASAFLAETTGALTDFTPGTEADFLMPPGKGVGSMEGTDILGVITLLGADEGTGIFGPKLTVGIACVTGIRLGGLILPFIILLTPPPASDEDMLAKEEDD